MQKIFLKIFWIVIVVSFIFMEVYHVLVGNYFDIIISLVPLALLVTVFGVYYLLKRRK